MFFPIGRILVEHSSNTPAEERIFLDKNSIFTCYRGFFCYVLVIWSSLVWFVSLELLGCFDRLLCTNCETLTVSVPQTRSATFLPAARFPKQLWYFQFGFYSAPTFTICSAYVAFICGILYHIHGTSPFGRCLRQLRPPNAGHWAASLN